MSELRDDLRFAARLLRKSPGFTAVALLTLALAIGANTALFSVVSGVLLRPLPFLEPEQLFLVVRRTPDGTPTPTSVPQYAFLSGQDRPFSRMAAWPALTSGFNLSEEALPERVPGKRVTRSFFEVLGVQLALGRGFLPEEDVPGGPRVVVVGHGLWQRRFAGRSDILGRSLLLDGEPYTIVGVAPPGFAYPEQAQLWIPLQLDMTSTEDAHYLTVIGRLKPEVDPAQVGSLIKSQGEQLRALRSAAVRPGFWMDAVELQLAMTRFVRPALLVLLGAVGLVLLIACVNLANLQLARATARERELAVRAALGASPSRIARQLLTESVLLSGAGGVLGLLLASAALPALLMLAPMGPFLRDRIHVDGHVLLFTLGVSVLTGMIFGLLPAWQVSRLDPRGSLQVSAWRSTTAAAVGRVRRVLVVAQMALALILLIGASLLVKSFVALIDTAPGIDARNVLTMKLAPPETRYGKPEAFEAFIQGVLGRVRALPGVQAVGFAVTLPFQPGNRLDFTIHGGEQRGDAQGVGEALFRPVTGGYFQALKIELASGRLLDDQDTHGSMPVAVINEATARRYWPGENPVGKYITIGTGIPQLADKVPREIIGVVRDVHELGLHAAPPAIVYIPLGQMSVPFIARTLRLEPLSLLLRGSGEHAAAVQGEIRAVDAMLPVSDILPMEELGSRSLGTWRFTTTMMGLMAGLALVLAAVGIYGVLSYLVSQRTREIGVRLALGASRGQVVWLVLRQGLLTVGVGVALGVAGAFALARLIEQSLYAVSPLDPLAFFVASGVLVGVALAAMGLPAWQASRVDPMVALRYE
jgi:predicted permease